MKIGRREFLAKTVSLTKGVVSAGLLPTAKRGRSENEGVTYKSLGRTGMKVSNVSLGAMQCAYPDVIRYAVSLGINYVDTADCYMGGQNEKIVGRALAGIRENVFIATKVHIADERRMTDSIERSLRSLKTDFIDLMQLHGLSLRGQVYDERAKNVLVKMKKEGKIRFAGVTTHSNQGNVVEAVIEEGFYDTVLVAYNFRSPRKLTNIIERAGVSNIGIIAMKTQNGGYEGSPFPGLTPHQAALKYVLDIPGVVTAIPGMYTKKMVDENMGVMGLKQDLVSDLLLSDYRDEILGRSCSFCSRCIEECAYKKGGIDAVRVGIYIAGYGDLALAKSAVSPRSVYRNVVRCSGCVRCTVSCPEGVDIPELARFAVKRLGGRTSI